MTNGIAAGRILAAQIEGAMLPWAPIFDPSRARLTSDAGAMVSVVRLIASDDAQDELGFQTRMTK